MRIEFENVDGGRPFVVEFDAEVNTAFADGEVSLIGTDYQRRQTGEVTITAEELEQIIAAVEAKRI